MIPDSSEAVRLKKITQVFLRKKLAAECLGYSTLIQPSVSSHIIS